MTDESPLLADDENGILCSARPATRGPSSRNRVEHRSGGDARLAEVEAGHARSLRKSPMCRESGRTCPSSSITTGSIASSFTIRRVAR